MTELQPQFDFGDLPQDRIDVVKSAISRGENFHGYIPEECLPFIVRNYRQLATMQALEGPWLDAYLFASHFNEYGLSVTKAIFEACRRERLRELQPLVGELATDETARVSIFRGCAGPVHCMGMSWTSSLDKAIWYAAQHVAYRELGNPAVYAATVQASEIYCRFDRNEEEFIVLPTIAWAVNVPVSEFRLNRFR